MNSIDAGLLRLLHNEPRCPVSGERSAAARLIAAGLLEEFGPHFWKHGRKAGKKVRLTRAGEAAWAKLPKPRSLMLAGPGPQWDCVNEAACIGGFAKEYPTAREAHCPPACAYRQDVKRETAGCGSSLALMQQHALGNV